MTLNDLAVLQSKRNDFPSAEAGYQEALRIRRDLARTNPQAYLPDVALTLNNLAVLKKAKNDFPSAEAGYQETLKVYRDLARTNPQTYLPYLAGALNNLAALQQDKNDYSLAEACYQESLKIRRDLARSNPQAYMPKVASALINFGIFYYKRPTPDKERSLSYVREAMRILQPLVKTLPYTQQYMNSALQLVKAWGIDPQEFLKQL
jgi:hypothetical protein